MTILKKAMSLNNELTEPIKELSELIKKHNEPINKLKACVCYFFYQIVIFFLPNGSPSKTMKNVFYFI